MCNQIRQAKNEELVQKVTVVKSKAKNDLKKCLVW